MNEIINKVANSGLVLLDLNELKPKGKRIGIDMTDFLFEGLVLREKDFREKIKLLDTEMFKDSFVYIFCSADAVVPLWAYFLLVAKLQNSAKKVIYGNAQDLEILLMEESIENHDFTNCKDRKVLVKGCGAEVPVQAYIKLISKLLPEVSSLMYGEACSSVPIYIKKLTK